MKQRSPKLTDYQKVRILEGYDKGITLNVLSEVLGIPVSTITSFKSRFMADIGLPVKEKLRKTKITGTMGVQIKKIARTCKHTGSRKMVQLLKKELPNESWYPSYRTLQRYLNLQKYHPRKHRLKPFINEKKDLNVLNLQENGWVITMTIWVLLYGLMKPCFVLTLLLAVTRPGRTKGMQHLFKRSIILANTVSCSGAVFLSLVVDH
jgi:hypothetical protein